MKKFVRATGIFLFFAVLLFSAALNIFFEKTPDGWAHLRCQAVDMPGPLDNRWDSGMQVCVDKYENPKKIVLWNYGPSSTSRTDIWVQYNPETLAEGAYRPQSPYVLDLLEKFKRKGIERRD